MVEMQTDMMTMTVDQMTLQLTKAYSAMVKNNIPFRRFPSVMLWGPPGVGKSQGVRQIARGIEERTGKVVRITDVRLLLFNPVDLRGIPTSNADKTLAIWLKPKIFQMDDSPDVVNILFLDEISAAPQSVQAAAYQITLDRTVGEHSLPENCIVMAAGNRVTDKSVAYNMPKALANRLCHMEIIGDHSSWHRWAVQSGIHSLVLGFLDQNPSMLMDFDAQSESLAFPTPRSWEMVSNILTDVSDNVAQVFPMIAGCIGPAAAYDLRNWSEIYAQVPEIEDIFAGTAKEVPLRPELLFALSAKMASYAKKHHSQAQIHNAVDYACRLPVEFRNRVFFNFLQIKAARKALEKHRVFNDWFLRSGFSWDEYGL